MTEKAKKCLIWNYHVTMTKKYAYISKEMQIRNHSLAFIHKSRSLFSATSVLSRSPMAYKTTASLDRLTCKDLVDFGKCQDRSGQFFWSKKHSNYLDVKLNVFKKDENKEFREFQNLTMGEAAFNHFMRSRKQLIIAAGNFAREENLSLVLTPTLSKDMDEKLKLAHKVVDVVDRANSKICVTLWTSLRVLMLKSNYLQGRMRTRNFSKLARWIINLKNLPICLM